MFAKQQQLLNAAHGPGQYVRDSGSCAVCHTHQGFLERLETGAWEYSAPSVDDVVPMNCRTCHQIHTTYTDADYARTADGIPVQFRVAGVAVDFGNDANLCAACHQSRPRTPMAVIDGEDVTFTSTHYGPHGSPQGDMFAGVGFYDFEGTNGGMFGPHASSSSNEKGCPTCHMAEGSQTVGGHTFEMGSGRSSNTKGCNTSGCHSGLDTFDYNEVQTEVQELLDELGHLIEEAGVGHYECETETSEDDHPHSEEVCEWHPVPGTYPANTVAAWWNFIGVVNDGSSGVHNPPYIKAILQGAIDALDPPPPGVEYVGSSTCQTCHVATYDDVFKSGHPYKVNKVVDGMAPTYPFSSVPNPPDGYTWADVSYVIGGYGWKARFIGTDGYIITAGGQNQWNLATQGWVDYHADEVKPYDCGACHTTGWQSLAENGGVNQDGLEGIHGTWSEPGVTCEACHGPGSFHVASQDASDITVDSSTELCNSCHVRGGDETVIPASGGFTKHREQGNQLYAGTHGGVLSCGSCHDPHIGTKYGHSLLGGIEATCESCHADQAASNAHLDLGGVPTCVDCHMPHTAKSAVAEHAYKGDVRSHIFGIDTDATKTKADMFSEDGSLEILGATTLDFACYSCHKDADGVGGDFSMKTIAELSAKATGIHN
jgi:hypothetical protein